MGLGADGDAHRSVVAPVGSRMSRRAVRAGESVFREALTFMVAQGVGGNRALLRRAKREMIRRH